MTLSKGRYREFPQGDTLVRLGSVIYDRIGKRIAYLVDSQEQSSEAGPEPETASRWFSVDPLTDSQESYSPYHYVYNNPVRFTDPDGRAPDDPPGFWASAYDAFSGFAAAMTDNNFGTNTREHIRPVASASAYSAGVAVGNVVSLAQGAYEVVTGGAALLGGGAVEVGTGGLATPAVAVTTVASAGAVAHGSAVVGRSLDGLVNRKGRVNADGKLPDADGNMRVKDLDPLHSKETVNKSKTAKDLEKLSDDDLLKTATNPKDGQKIKVNTKTGKLVDGNTRAYELKKRAADPNSSITPDTKVPVDKHRPEDID